MSDIPQNTKPQWGAIVMDMFILVAAMGALAYICNLAMKPFEHVAPTDSLVSLIRKGAVRGQEDQPFLNELAAMRQQGFINAGDTSGRTPLMWAAYANFNDPAKTVKKDLERLYYVKALLAEPSLKLDAEDKDGFNALHWAAWSGMPQTSMLLVQAGLNINEPEKNGYTPLMLAAKRGNSEVVQMLLQLGADATLVNKEGNTAFQLAVAAEKDYSLNSSRVYTLIYSENREKGYRETVELLDSSSTLSSSAKLF